MKSFKRAFGLAAALATGLGVQSAQAVLITDFNAVAQTTFSTFGGVGTITGSLPNAVLGGSTTLTWGTPFPPETDPSSLVIGNNTGSNGEFDTSLAPNNGAADIQTNDGLGEQTSSITHNNNVIFTPTTLRTFTVRTSAVLTPVVPPGGASIPLPTLDFTGEFQETPNREPCVAAGATVCPDIFVLTTDLFSAVIPGGLFGAGFADFNYLAELFDPTGGLGVLPDAVCAAAGAAAGCRGFTTEENAATTIGFNLRISAIPVLLDEPAVVALLGLGLLGIGVANRRRKRV